MRTRRRKRSNAASPARSASAKARRLKSRARSHQGITMAGREDLYIVLQVGRSASENDIKRAFRKLARRFHPDINPGDQRAEERFKRITEAYDILSDPLKREFYDINGFYTDGVLEERGDGSNWGFQCEGFDFSRSHEGDFREIFENIFARQNRQTPERGL